ncbi:hypothetical protein CC77DRAFT_485377 [Alternaria alternata]|uniref:Meiotically up-regulated protein Msb1/Mug8 domain-containing protein n=2 Tax=Alternaria alternata complex TaxID=187734 RepID=A0A177D5K2_ALTAL|nr:hypothetical protein CC77DRAFT_485377 [Alternaria alternata]RII07649.1 hypothetical protein CUC08_Gglean008619 [Alternaria sp. MG1]RYN33238.1 hypothetical protein AA0115_g3065 [Alternaria tenuissima]KAH6849088.1 hypothetical protein B0T12DRAFT_204382 [Alternaria alternata]OAG14954.1 hypothetical protein CC77DRAFT_485377 [Alternaria alternata]OWY43920.1 protein of unknown function DUF1708 [Alternaria alternata]
MPFFKSVFHSKDKQKGAKTAPEPVAPPKPRWEESWTRKDVAPDEIQELIHVCTQEMKSRALDMPFMLLPFRPTSDTSASRNFIRNFFKAAYENTRQYSGEGLAQELRLTEPLTLCSIIKWCWSRLPGGVVTWDAYELFRIGESDSNFARHAFDTFIPISVDSEARKRIIFDFFDLLSSVAARGKSNGMGGRKLSRLAGWWAFEFVEDGKGFDGGYRTWEKAADAASHLFFAYLRSLSPDMNVVGGISALPRSLQALLTQTEYPPQTPTLMQTRTTKVVMIVDSVSPTPFALLRRAKNFEYRDDDRALQQFSAYEDTVKALTDECQRVLKCIATANQSTVSTDPTTPDPSWSRFEDFGFSGIMDSSSSTNGASVGGSPREFSSLRSGPHSNNTDLGRPTTPSWADFLSSGFADENNQSPPTTLLMPNQKLPPLGENRVHSSQSHVRNGLNEDDLEPGELASITKFDLDETFWWVWMISLASEETTDRKAAFGRCTLIETRIQGAKWLVMEEQVKGASPGPEEGAYIAEKKSKFSFTRRGRLGRRKSTGKKPTPKEPYNRTTNNTPMSKTSIGPDQHARIQAAAAKLAKNERDEKDAKEFAQRRGRTDDTTSVKTNSVLTLQPHLVNEAGPAMQWDKKFGEAALDKDALRAQYLGDVSAGRGSKNNLMASANGRSSPLPPEVSNRDLPALPKSERGESRSPARIDTKPTEASVTPVPWPNDSPTQTPQQQSFPVPVAQDQSTPIEETPFATPLPISDEKSVQSGTTPNQHPALRKAVPERKPVVAPQPKSRVSEDHGAAPGKKISPNKLKKKEGGGFRKLFGRKKTETPAAVATTAPADDSYFQASDALRSNSRLDDHQSNVREPSPTYTDDQPEPIRAPSPQHEPSPAASSGIVEPNQAGGPVAGGPATQQEIDQAFSRFDQGPMEDMPAFAPADDESDDDAAAAPTVPRRQMQQTNPRTPTQRAPEYADDISEESVEFTKQQSPSQDRWAQIRKNAAERAARLSEEQVRRSRSQSQSQRTDEGETSGEETIESRVARIKARVAELTGNVDGQPGAGAGGRQW